MVTLLQPENCIASVFSSTTELQFITHLPRSLKRTNVYPFWSRRMAAFMLRSCWNYQTKSKGAQTSTRSRRKSCTHCTRHKSSFLSLVNQDHQDICQHCAILKIQSMQMNTTRPQCSLLPSQCHQLYKPKLCGEK